LKVLKKELMENGRACLLRKIKCGLKIQKIYKAIV